MNTPPPWRDRFWAKVTVVQDDDSCWEWQAGKFWDGYGMFSLGGKSQYAHRAAYILEHGSIPPSMDVLHRCGNKSCVRPSHLYAGTQSENNHDAIRHGTFPTGKRNGMRKHPPKLSESKADGLRAVGATTNMPYQRLGPLFGVSGSMACYIVNNKSWSKP